ncbi:hypothetical protein E4U42_002292 [Claviceps africana]|uniref:DUF7729 domain-containing protein n=1 Tax=Claviceps africana TaxID=83212 RepID=A0A8K0J9N7_9HYPO|nr:hypothetical protein E4U42_002292 [Claviceps africana]
MTVSQSSQPTTEADVHHAPSISQSSLHLAKQRPGSGKRRLLRRITLPLAVLAVAATFNSYVVAKVDAAALTLARPPSLDKGASFSSVSDDAETVLANSGDSVPPAHEEESLELKVRRTPSDASLSNSYSAGTGNGGVVVDEVSRASRALSRRATEATDGGSSPLPSPFDSLVPSAFQIPGGSNACPRFMSSLLSDPAFKQCYPLSLLMQKLVSIVKVLDATCAPNVIQCTEFMSQAALNLTSEANCKDEYEQNQTQVLLAYRGLRAYSVMYSAACLQDPASNSYCFANAVTNLSTPSNSYLYFMPYGLALPGASKPTCNWCTQATMGIYHEASADRGQPVANKYEDAAQQVNTLCGPNFVNSSLPAAESTALSIRAPSGPGIMMSTLLTLVFASCLL